MVRLAVSGDESAWHGVASRLLKATIETCFDVARMPAPPEACDAMVFVGHNHPEPELIERCLSAGKHVLLATGPYVSSDVLETLSVAARDAEVRLAIVNPDRFLPSRQVIRQQLDAGCLGAPGLVRLHRWEPAAGRTLDMSPGWVRDLELAIWLAGKLPNLVYAIEPVANDRDTLPGPILQIHLGFPEGAMALIDYAACLPAGEGYQSLSVIGSAGAAYADDHQNMQLVYQGGRPRAMRADEGAVQLGAMVQEFVDALHAGHDFAASVSAWRDVLAVVEAVERSLVSRQAIALTPEDR
jgi:predicted dehydrogenase